MLANMVIKNRGLGKKLSLSEIGKRVARSGKGFDLLLDQRVWSKNEKGERTSQLPDIICIDQKSKRVTILEVAVAAEDLIGVKEWEKENKYRPMVESLKKKYQGYKVRSLQFVVGQLEILTKCSVQHLKIFRACSKLRAPNKGNPEKNSSMENIISKIQNVGLKGSLNIYAWFTGAGSNRAESLAAQCIPEETGERAELPENFHRKMLESFRNRERHKALTVRQS